MKFKVGDKVKLARKDSEWDWYKNYLGKIFIIKEIGKYWNNEEFAELEENDVLMPFIKNLDLVKPEYTYEDLKKAPIGTKITFEDGKTLVKVGNDDINDSFTDINASRSIRDLKGLKDSWLEGYFGKITKIEEPEYTTVYESKPDILDEVEKRYLRNIVNPFKDKVISICKIKSLSHENKEYITINIKNEDTITLPYFDKDTMYKGMKVNTEYTLKGLGI